MLDVEDEDSYVARDCNAHVGHEVQDANPGPDAFLGAGDHPLLNVAELVAGQPLQREAGQEAEDAHGGHRHSKHGNKAEVEHDVHVVGDLIRHRVRSPQRLELQVAQVLPAFALPGDLRFDGPVHHGDGHRDLHHLGDHLGDEEDAQVGAHLLKTALQRMILPALHHLATVHDGLDEEGVDEGVVEDNELHREDLQSHRRLQLSVGTPVLASAQPRRKRHPREIHNLDVHCDKILRSQHEDGVRDSHRRLFRIIPGHASRFRQIGDGPDRLRDEEDAQDPVEQVLQRLPAGAAELIAETLADLSHFRTCALHAPAQGLEVHVLLVACQEGRRPQAEPGPEGAVHQVDLVQAQDVDVAYDHDDDTQNRWDRQPLYE
mmetsp:Transcript_50590/g.120672  ORF Transcript_50590/g.120672 Transcript_50590/m.120672 type:complete len:375 (-) Transcript_50590:944-2068(-)